MYAVNLHSHSSYVALLPSYAGGLSLGLRIVAKSVISSSAGAAIVVCVGACCILLRILGVLGSSPLPVVHCCCLEMPLDRHNSATMKIQGSCWSVCCTAEPVHCCSKSFVARVVLLSCQMLS